MAKIESGDLDYRVGETRHCGYFACEAGISEPRPGVIVIHEWWGIDEHIRGVARRLAELGFAAFAIDMFGNGKTADEPAQAAGLMNGVLSDMETGTERLRAAYDTLVAQPEVDESRTAAFGYCFGGAMALHMARIGLPLKAVVSFHGALGSFHTAEPGSIQARILVCHGEDDAMVSMDNVADFRREMDRAQADYEVIVYPGAQHGFAVPEATERGRKFGIPVGHDANAESQSWQAMMELFDAVF